MRQMEYVYGQSLDDRFHRAVDNYIGVMSFLQECAEVCLFPQLNVVVFFYIRLHHKEACRIRLYSLSAEDAAEAVRKYLLVHNQGRSRRKIRCRSAQDPICAGYAVFPLCSVGLLQPSGGGSTCR